ncbi:glycoside hydrolase family 15 protein [Phytoactinopolyspora alkaliphila]|uniref:Glycoside hydrolase family 15 protein n=1 Tax=Phytoactinopolyspora alkaliphila TaxID=1783498 RepID=A0A6N9YLM9_9ACTN|nr:glycoside hydrolase family 15 protein [Phytoactinopolyspora alkaliphila]NED95903.1 glycoside hydrolase family 15 protein [Phytoactinopolyspora alkaliphila]
MSQSFPPIGEYAYLSDCHTAALIGPDGAVEWLCAPRFDSPSVFARILDRERGGAWELEVSGTRVVERDYVPGTLVLRSRWAGEQGDVTVYDFLAARTPPGSAEVGPTGRLVRLVTCDQGRARVRSRVRARPGYGVREGRWEASSRQIMEREGLLFSADPLPALMEGGLPGVDAELAAGEAVAMALDYPATPTEPVTRADAERLRDETVRAWQRWSARSDYDGAGATQVRHSAVVLRGMLFDESDALIAAPTTSLPEWPGGPRNWDYRYMWPRDAGLVVLELLRLGHEEEAGRYVGFLLSRCDDAAARLAPVFCIDGAEVAGEKNQEHLAGYLDSLPVRTGNEAATQHQLDVYGHVLEAALAYHEVTGKLTEVDLTRLWHVVDINAKRWREPDSGIWEVQGPERHWTHSKLYAWACFDRAIRLAEHVGSTQVPITRWRRERELVREDVLNHEYDDAVGSFVQSYGSTNVDASLLRLPLLGFLDGDDPRVVATLERIDAELGDGTGLIHRYDPGATEDGMDSPEGAFLLCSFEMISALVLAGRAAEAERRFAALCERAGSLGLFSEQMTTDGTMLGNYPQAFTHLSIIQAALNLDEAGRTDALHGWADRRGGVSR